MDHIEKQKRKSHPKNRNTVISNIFFIYALKLFRKGFKRDLEESDLYEVLPDYRSKKLGDHLEQEWEKQKEKRKKLSIFRLLWSCYGLSYISLGCMQLFMDIVELIVQPYALAKLVSYFSPGQTNLTKNDAYFYAMVLIGFNFFSRVYKHNYLLLITGLGIKIRTAFCSFMYRKALKLSPAHLGDTSIGKIVTLMTRDVQSFEVFINYGNDIWIGIIKVVVASCILYMRTGVAALIAVGSFLIVIPFQLYLGTKITSLKMKACKKTDERLQVTQETLSAMKIIKMYTWENIFNSKISATRRNELHATYKIFLLKYLILVISDLDSYIAFYVMLVTYIQFGNNVTAEIVYFIMTTFETLVVGLSYLFPIAVYETAELKSAVERIGHIAKGVELHSVEPKYTIKTMPKISINDLTVKIKNQTILDNVSLTIKRGLTLVTGPVGSGKSFLLKTILQDYKPENGTLLIEGNISYASQDPWLFPSSIKQNILFGEKFNEKRYQEVLKACALIYDLQLLEDRDNTIVEDRGFNLSKGQQVRINLARALYKDTEIYLLDDPLVALDAHVSAYIFKECILKFSQNKLIVLVTHNINYLKDAEKTIIMENGRKKLDVKSSELQEIERLNINDNDKNKQISITTHSTDEDDDINEDTTLITEITNQKKVYQEHKKSGKVESKVYKKYIQLGGGFTAFFTVLCIFVLAQVSMRFTEKLISNWVNLEETIFNSTITNSTNATRNEELFEKRNTIFYWYNALAISTAVTALCKASALFYFARRASLKLHKNMITSVINASLQFFDNHFIGNILNRFSKDLVIVDETVPFVFYHVLGAILGLIGILISIVTVNLIFLVPTAIVFIILILIRQYCLRTTRSLKRLEVLTRSPIVGYVNATLEGLTTIRAFKAERILKDEFDSHQDLYSSVSYMLQSSMRAFAFVLDVLCGIFVACIIVIFLVNDNGTLAGDVGLALTQSYYLTGILQWGIRQWIEIENQMTSVERVLEYTEIKQENRQGLTLSNWPKQGEIKFDNVCFSYTNSNETMLKNINFTVKPRQKIGIVGRTGAGKSSIISTLFRLYEAEGKITIDGVDIKTLSLDILRTNISIIPQDPVMFSGTIRDNVDPTGTYTDGEIWNAIESAHLKNFVSNLDFEVVEGGSNFSVGQRQLICLARAVIRKNKIIILDEATANMDPETDALIYETIKANFASCTVVIIAHKLNSILDTDKVMVLDNGEIVEYDEPENLLQNQEGIFYKMVTKAGLLSKAN